MPAEPGDGPAQERRRGGALLVPQDLDVGEAGGVIDADVDELPADGADAPRALLAARGPLATMAGHPVARVMDPPQLLDVDVDQLPGSLAFVAVRWLGWRQGPAPAEAHTP
jgi:hypothetical protein